METSLPFGGKDSGEGTTEAKKDYFDPYMYDDDEDFWE